MLVVVVVGQALVVSKEPNATTFSSVAVTVGKQRGMVGLSIGSILLRIKKTEPTNDVWLVSA